MRCLDRDRRSVHIARFVETAPIKDEQGRFTGRNEVVRSEPDEFLATVSADRGNAQNDYFGQKVDYDRTLTVDDPDFKVGESDVLWIENKTSQPHDYVVTRVAKQGDYTIIAAKKVDVTK